MRTDALYASPAARAHALRLAMWIFLASETLLFSVLFALYAAYRVEHAAAFARAGAHNELWIGTLNTVVLIVSSFFVASASTTLRAGRRHTATACLGGAIVLGLTFLGLKSIEYAHHLADGIRPGAAYAFAELPEPGARMFWNLYYCLTGLHALHVIAGLAIMTWLGLRIRGGKTTPASHVELELGGLYWHLVDVVWIFLWPLLYLSA